MSDIKALDAVEKPQAMIRDTDRFKLLFKNGRPSIPAGYTAPLGTSGTRELIAARVAEITAAASTK